MLEFVPNAVKLNVAPCEEILLTSLFCSLLPSPVNNFFFVLVLSSTFLTIWLGLGLHSTLVQESASLLSARGDFSREENKKKKSAINFGTL